MLLSRSSQGLRHCDDCEKLGERVEPILLIMSRLTEIQKAIEELAPEEKEELRDWLDGRLRASKPTLQCEATFPGATIVNEIIFTALSV